ncbi:hypothetical protein RHA1_ro08832 (plasmid) [Rhodococcus jostii RHA1]|uniref:Uncharacterized protein n=1 Tax=Rhodococcus jostii (strain RHA1) TaxID=101510 RepID=Q0RXW0_RHOJR|nr:hypothetical protein RHA1_ro08832 [Rhodococcus jostii RHA1]
MRRRLLIRDECCSCLHCSRSNIVAGLGPRKVGVCRCHGLAKTLRGWKVHAARPLFIRAACLRHTGKVINSQRVRITRRRVLRSGGKGHHRPTRSWGCEEGRPGVGAGRPLGTSHRICGKTSVR